MQPDAPHNQEVNNIPPLLAELRRTGIPCTCDEPLSAHTSFRIGGPAAVFCRPVNVGQLKKILSLCRQYNVRSMVLGNGSNVLFADEGFAGAVISTLWMENPVWVAPQPDGAARLHAGAGASLAALCRAAQKHGLTGLEFAWGIPGTVGGAVYMNAGAYGSEMKDVLTSVYFLDESGAQRELPAAALELGYRTSLFAAKPWCVTSVSCTLRPGDPAAIAARMQELMQRRRDKQPLELPSAGSTFKRPPGAFAGKLIEDCGLRGFAVGGAMVSEKHCGFVVNTGGATCADVLALTEEVRRVVREKTGYDLEREIRVVR